MSPYTVLLLDADPLHADCFELALLIEKAWTSGLDSKAIDISLNYYEAKRELEKKSRGR